MMTYNNLIHYAVLIVTHPAVHSVRPQHSFNDQRIPTHQ